MGKHRIFMVNQRRMGMKEGNLDNFPGAVIITPEPVESKYISGAWNYAVRKTSSALLTVHYEKAIELLRQNHPDWTIIYPEVPVEVNFRIENHDMEHYTPPD